MNCQRLETLWVPYLDGELPAGQQKAVAAHLAACVSCAERVKGFAEVSGLLEQWPGIEPSPWFNTRLQQRLAQETTSAGWLRNGFLRLIAPPLHNPILAMTMLVVVCLAVILTTYSPAPPEQLASEQPSVTVALASGLDEVSLYRNLPVLEDWEMLRNFEVLQELESKNP